MNVGLLLVGVGLMGNSVLEIASLIINFVK